MGCSQSKATDLVVERVSAEAPAADVPATTEVAVEQPEEAVVEASEEAAAAPDQGEEQAEAAAEAPKEEAPAPVEAVAEETLAPVEEEPKEEAVAPAEEVAEEAAPVEEPEEEAAAPVEEAAESTPVVDDAPEVVAEETTPTPEAEAEAAAPVEEAAAAEESAAVESAPKSQVEVVSGDEKPAASGVTFASGDVSFDDKGVAFYNIQGSDPEDPAKDVRVSKRYSEFKALHAEIARVLAASQEDKTQPTPALPAMPKASFLHRRTNKKMLEERETQFVAMLNAIASHPVAAQSEVFATFIMGCTQSKTNEQVADPAATSQTPADQPPVSAAAPEDSAPANSVEAPPAVEAETEAPVVEKPELKAVDGALNFVPGEVTFNEHGIAFYNFDGSSPADPSKDIHVSKRYSEFKAMHVEIAKLMASEKNVPTDQQDKFQTYAALPALPKANAVTFLRGRGNKMVVDEREAQFVKILNAIARHPIAFQSETFTEFLA
ncbi:hypothetical protein BBJ28_00006061 [Nothophytophthora sp. Chile5]|nr:hypothetical protein BBJ28_00006061 [Nothophytophthora sp. Chile5]